MHAAGSSMAFVGSGPATPFSPESPYTPPTKPTPLAPAPILPVPPLRFIKCPRATASSGPGFFQHGTDSFLRKYAFLAALRNLAAQTRDYRSAYVIDERMKVIDAHICARAKLTGHFRALLEQECQIMSW